MDVQSFSMDPSASMRHLLVHYNEIALKGKNRRFFEEKLLGALRFALGGLGFRRVKRLSGRLLVEFRQEVPWDQVRERVSRVHGVSHFARARKVALDLAALKEALGEALVRAFGDRGALGDTGALSSPPRSFAVITHRPNKTF